MSFHAQSVTIFDRNCVSKTFRIEHVRIFADIRFEMEDDLVILTFEFRMLSSNTFTAEKRLK